MAGQLPNSAEIHAVKKAKLFVFKEHTNEEAGTIERRLMREQC